MAGGQVAKVNVWPPGWVLGAPVNLRQEKCKLPQIHTNFAVPDTSVKDWQGSRPARADQPQSNVGFVMGMLLNQMFKCSFK